MFNFSIQSSNSDNYFNTTPLSADKDVVFKERSETTNEQRSFPRYSPLQQQKRKVIEKTNSSVKRKLCFEGPDLKKVHHNPPTITITPIPSGTHGKITVKTPTDLDDDIDLDKTIEKFKSIQINERIEIIDVHSYFEGVINLNDALPTNKNGDSEFFKQ